SAIRGARTKRGRRLRGKMGCRRCGASSGIRSGIENRKQLFSWVKSCQVPKVQHFVVILSEAKDLLFAMDQGRSRFLTRKKRGFGMTKEFTLCQDEVQRAGPLRRTKNRKTGSGLRLGHAALEGEQDQVRAAAPLAGENGIHETRKHGARHPKAAIGNERQSAGKLIARFGVGEDALYAQTEQRIGVGFVDRITNNNQAGIGEALEDIGEERAGSLTCGVRIYDVDLRLRRFKVAQVGSKSGFKLLGNDLELRSLAEQAFKFA